MWRMRTPAVQRKLVAWECNRTNAPVQRRALHRLLCRAVHIFTLVLLNQGRMQLPHRFDFRAVGKRLGIEAQANLDVFLREIVAVNQHFANLVGGIGVLALVGVVVLEQELAVAVLDDRLRVGLNLRHHAQDFGDLDVDRRLGAVEDVADGVGGFVAVVHPLGVGVDLAVVAGDELEEAQKRRLYG